jgi:hypothetical protein
LRDSSCVKAISNCYMRASAELDNRELRLLDLKRWRWQKKNSKGRWVELRWTMEEEEAAQYAARHNVELRKVPGSRGEEITNVYGNGGSMMPKPK